MQKFRVKQAVLVESKFITDFKVNKTFSTTFHTAKHYFSTLAPVILRLFIKNASHG